MKAFLQSAVVAGIIGLACSCSKKPAAPTPEAAVISTPSGTLDLADVNKALAQKDYEGAIDVIAKVKPLVSGLTESQQAQFSQKIQDILTALQDVKYSDAKAMAAYKRLGLITSGR